MVSSGTKTSSPVVGPFRNAIVNRVMAPSNRDSGRIGRNQCGRNAVFILIANQVIGVTKLERESEYGSDRRQCDVAFVPVQADANDGLAIPFSLCRPRRNRLAMLHPNQLRAKSAQNRESRFRRPAPEGNGSSAPQFRNAATVLQAQESWARQRSMRRVGLRLASLAITIALAYAENSRPPYCFGIIIAKKRFSMMKSQTSFGMSARLWQISQSSSIWHNCSHGPSMNACSSSDKLGCREGHEPVPLRACPKTARRPTQTLPASQRFALRVRHRGQHLAINVE